MELTAAKWK